MSRLHLAKEAVRPEMKARLLLAGPPGAGKTHTALTIARELANGGQILVIDTEEESALTYADNFAFTHLPWREPFDPQELGRDLQKAAGEGYAVAVVDSTTHFWNGKGGVLEIADGKFGGWKAARPAHRDLVQGFLRAQLHMILCVRSKVAHVVTEDANGKQRIEKLGMAPIQDSELEYELNVTAELDLQHKLSISKTRCAPLAGREFDAHHEIDFAHIYREWLKGGEPLADLGTTSDFLKRLNELPDDSKLQAKKAFMERFGRPEHLAKSQVKDAEKLIKEWEKKAKPAEPTDEAGNIVQAAFGGEQ